MQDISSNGTATLVPEAKHEPVKATRSEEDAEHEAELAIFSNPAAHGQPTTEEEYDEARSIITQKLPTFRPIDALLAVNINPEYPTLFIDARQDPPKLLDDTAEEPSAIVRIRPEYVVRLDEGTMEPRYGVNMGNIITTGSSRLGMQFCDLLCPKNVQPIDPQPLPPLDELPKPVTDYKKAWSDLKKYGYCLIKDALSPDQLKALKGRLEEQASCEDSIGLGYHDGGTAKPNQRVWNLQNKGDEFVNLLEHPMIDWFMSRILGDGFLLSSYSANIARPGGRPMFMHCDQMPINPAIREVTLGANIAWFLDEVTEENGGTRVLVGSHRGRIAPRDMFDTAGTIATQGPAGTALVFDSRLWHCTGANVAKGGERKLLLTFFIRYFLRPQENSFLSLSPGKEETFSEKLKALLGYRVTGTLGGIEGFNPDGTITRRLYSPLGELKKA